MNEITSAIKLYGTGLNYDDDPRMMQEGDARDRLNMVFEKGSDGVAVNIKGTEYYASQASTSGVQDIGDIVIGTCEWTERGALIYFVYNATPANNKIILFEPYDGNSFTIILKSAELNFDNFSTTGINISPYKQYGKIHNARIVGDGENATLIFTDGINEVRSINIEKAINGDYNSIGSEFLNLARKPFTIAGTTNVTGLYTYYYNSNIKTNNLNKKLFQFSYRLVYSDNTKSVWSLYSPSPYRYDTSVALQMLPFDDIFGRSNPFTSFFNSIRLAIYSTSLYSPDLVSNIEIAVREGDVGSGVIGNWELYDTIRFTSGTVYYYFDNTKNKTTLDQSEFAKQYEYIPQTSGAIEAINENRIVLGDIVEGYDYVDINVSLGTYQNTSSIPSTPIYIGGSTTTLPSASSPFNYDFSTMPITSSRAFRVVLQVSDGGNIYNFSTPLGEISDAEIAEYFDYLDIASIVPDISSTSSSGTTLTINLSGDIDYFMFYEVDAYYRYPTNKTGSKQYYGITYYDEFLRSSSVCISDDSVIEIPVYDNTSNRYPTFIEFTISHTAPSWAKYFTINYGGSNIQSFTTSIVNVKDDIDLTNGNLYIDVNRYIKKMQTEFSDYNVGTYTLSAGDKIRFIGYGTLPTSSTTDINISTTSFDTTNDVDEYIFDIISQDGDDVIIEDVRHIFNKNGHDIVDGSSTTFYIVELLTYGNVSQEDVFYKEITPLMEINSSGYHLVSPYLGTNQSSGVDAVINLTYGDSYLGYINVWDDNSELNVNSIFNTKIESRSYSLFYDSDFHFEGRLNIYNPTIKQERKNLLRWGGVITDNSNVNLINRFGALDAVQLDDKHGVISALRQVGDTLLCLQKNKVTSFYLQKEQSVDATGSGQVSYSDVVIGTPNPSIEEFGTVNPESVVKTQRNLYFYDLYNGKVIRYSTNGMQPISDYKMERWFYDISSYVSGLYYSTNPQTIYASFDHENDLYYIMLGSDITSYIGFHEPTNKWISFYSYGQNITSWGCVGEKMLYAFDSSNNGRLNLINADGANRCTIFGGQVSYIIEILVNQNPNIIKTFDSIEIHSDELIYPQSNGDIYVEGKNVSSRMLQADIRLEEGVYRSEFKRNTKTRSTSNNNWDLHNGELLRGQHMFIKLRADNTDGTDSTEKNRVFFVRVFSSPSA